MNRRSMHIRALVALSVSIFSCPEFVRASETTAAAPRVSAIRVAVADLDESLDFYTRRLGCRMTFDGRKDDYLVLDNHGVCFVLTKSDGPVRIRKGQCHVRVNFKITDLDGWTAGARAAGVRILGESKSAVGRYVTFLDPSGNRHNMKKLDHEKEQLNTPRVYDVGIAVSDMKRGRTYYGDALGFSVMTEKYYPPVVPFTQNGCAFFILSEEDAKKPAPYRYGKTGWTGLAMEVSDIAAAMKDLRRRGVRFLDDEPIHKGPVLCASFADPFGNIHELIEHVKPDADNRSTGDARPATVLAADMKQGANAESVVRLADLAWMSGRWTANRDGQELEEVWSGPIGGTLTGMFRWSRQGKTFLYEIITIEEEDDGRLVYRMRHFNRGLKPWESEKDAPLTMNIVQAAGASVTFEDPEREFPRRIEYERAGDVMHIRLIGANGKVQSFELTRAD